ncbi:MAG: 6-phosphofructokinase [Clostridia bacterium]|nr:6-phosphofructokinase [Clostridia bacterium]
MKTIAVLTSGGDSPGMNACIRSVVRYGISQGLKVFGIRRGYDGLINDDIFPMNERSVGNIVHVGGTMLKTARSKEFMTKEGLQKAVENLKSHEIDGLVVIGGDGSYRGAMELSKMGITVACVPGTIDNNLFYTDFTLGFDTAANTIANLINNVRDTSVSHDRISVVEVMGAGCGDLALEAGLASGADVILVPEVPWSIDDVCNKLVDGKKRGKQSSIIILSEHVCDPNDLAKMVTQKTGIECRTVILGHVQRGGSPSAFDRNLAMKCGARAVDGLMQEESGATGYRGGKIIYVPIKEALNGKRKFNMEMYNLALRLSI